MKYFPASRAAHFVAAVAVCFGFQLASRADEQTPLPAPVKTINFKGKVTSLHVDGGKLDLIPGGLNGQALRVGDPTRSVSINIDEIPIDWKQGTISFWFKPLDWKEKGRNRNWLHTTTPPRNINLNFVMATIQDVTAGYGSLCFQLKDLELRPSHNWNGFTDWQNGQWYFATAAWDKQNASVYLNGELDAPGGGHHDIGQTIDMSSAIFKGGILYIGTDAGWKKYPTVEHSAMDQIEFRSQCLSDDQVRQLYYEQRPAQSHVATAHKTVKLPFPNPPRVTVPADASAPTIDGNVNDAEWADAATIAALNDENTATLCDKPFIGYIKSDGKNLYIAFKTRVHTIEELTHTNVERDSQTYLDDSWEIYLRPPGGPDSPKSYQVVVNSAGAIFDWRDGNLKWNGNWTIKQRVERPDIWDAEIAIPLSDFGITGDVSGTDWKAGIFFNQKTPDVRSFGWTPLQGLFDQPDHLATLHFATGKPIVGLASLGRADAGAVEPTIVASKDAPGTLLTLKDYTGKVYTHTLTGDARSYAFPALQGKGEALLTVISPPEATPETATFQYSTIVAYDSVPLTIKTVNYPSRQQLTVEVNYGSLEQADAVTAYSIDFGSGPHVSPRQSKIPWEKFTVSTSDLNPGQYKPTVALLGKNNQVVVTKSVEYTKEGAEAWLHNTVGIQPGYVPPPYEPMAINGSTVRVIGRNLEMSDTGLPQSILSKGVSVLSEPVKLTGELNNQTETLRATKPFAFDDVHPDDSTGHAQVALGQMTGELKQTVSFDGFCWYDLTLTSPTPVDAKNVRIEIRLPNEVAKNYLLTDPDYKLMNLEDWEIGDVIRHDMNLCFMPQIYLGNDDVGLAWLAETHKGWQVLDDKKVIQIVHEGNDVLLRINIVDEPITLKEPLKLGFGFQASPIKPVSARQQHFAFSNGRFPEFNKDMEVFGVYQGHVAERPATFENYTGLPEPSNPSAALEEAAKQKMDGQNLTPYSEFTWLSLGIPEMKTYGGDWYLGQPWAAVSGMAAHPEPFGLVDTENQDYQDFIVQRFVKNWDGYGGSSIYYDLCSPAQNKDPDFHRAYTTRSGRTAYPWPFRSIRNIIRRLYIGYSQKSPTFVRFTHASNLYLPIVAFGDAWPVGEHFSFSADRYPEVLSYDRYHAWLYGYPIGVKTMFLPSLKSPPLVAREELTRYLVGIVFNHNTTFWVSFINEAVLRPYLRVFHGGDWPSQTFLPYWKYPHLTNLDPEKFKVSGWYNESEKKGLLCIASLSPQEITADVQLGPDWHEPTGGQISNACLDLLGPREYSMYLPGATLDGHTATFKPYGVLMLNVK